MAQVSLKQLEAFVAVADLGTFRRAAERLNTTQPNISARIAQLEAQMKVSLMERDAGSVRLTPRGRVLLARARAVLGEVDQFIAAAGDSTLFEGVLRLGVSELVAHTWLRPFLLEMRARYPSVTVELTVEQSAHLSPLLFGGDLDLTFQNGPFDRRATSTRPLGAAPYLWAASRRWGWGGARWNPPSWPGTSFWPMPAGPSPIASWPSTCASCARACGWCRPRTSRPACIWRWTGWG